MARPWVHEDRWPHRPLWPADLTKRLDAALNEEEGLYACPTCGESVRHYGQRCDRCKASIEEDRLNRGD